MEFDGSTCELEISEVMEGADKHLVRWRSSDFEVMVEDRCTGGLMLVEEGNTETKSDKMTGQILHYDGSLIFAIVLQKYNRSLGETCNFTVIST